MLNHVPHANIEGILGITEWLHGQLPSSSSLYHLMRGVNGEEINEQERSKFHVYADAPFDPHIICAIRLKQGEVSCCLHSDLESLSRGIIDDLARVLEKSARESGLHICFMALEARFLEEVKEGMARVGMEYEWKEPAALYYLPPNVNVPSSSLLAEGYLVTQEITEDDLVTIDSTWKYRSAHSLDMIRKMVAAPNQPQVGVRESKGGKLVAWVMCYGDKSIGMMYTLPEHRSKGLGKAVAARVVELYRCHFTEGSGDPYCYIVDGNEASLKVYEKGLGFKKVRDTYWSGFSFPK